MKDDIKEIGTDVEILATVLSQQAKPKRKTTYHKVSESKFQSKIQYNNDEEK